MSLAKRILVTGSAGRIGRAVVSELLARGHHPVGFDRVPTPNLPAECAIVGDVFDAAAVGDVLFRHRCDGVIHLAATPDDARYPRGPAPDDGDNFLSELVPNNIVGPYAVMEAVRALKVPRVILASTGQVIGGHLLSGNVPVTPDTPYQPRYLYACTKVFLEALGQVYAREHGIEVLAVRLGWCPRPGQEAEFEQSSFGKDVYLSPGDAGRFFAAAVEAPKLPPYAVVYAASRHVHTHMYDLTSARELLGWEPQDRWPSGIS